MERRLGFFDHIARSAPDEDHHRAVAAAICKPPSDWKRPPGRPKHVAESHWIGAETTEHRHCYAWKKAASREHWRSIVDRTALKKSRPMPCWDATKREWGMRGTQQAAPAKSQAEQRTDCGLFWWCHGCGAVMGKSQIKYLPQISNVWRTGFKPFIQILNLESQIFHKK